VDLSCNTRLRSLDIEIPLAVYPVPNVDRNVLLQISSIASAEIEEVVFRETLAQFVDEAFWSEVAILFKKPYFLNLRRVRICLLEIHTSMRSYIRKVMEDLDTRGVLCFRCDNDLIPPDFFVMLTSCSS
jgi:hypothetical protein